MTRAVPPTSGARLLADLAALGPYFAVDVHRSGSPVRPPWQPLGELISSPGALARRIGEVRERLAAAAGCPAAAVEFRVAASIAQLGLCARLLSPALGAAAAGWALRVDTAGARWVPALGGPFPLSLPDTAAGASAGASEGEGTAECLRLLTGPVARIVRVVASMAVSPRVLWGNVASAVNGAAIMIAAARPELTGSAAGCAAAMLRYPALARTYQGRPLTSFRRRNCCLIYRLSPAAPAYCGDCVLGRQRPRRSLTCTQHVVTRHQQCGASVFHPLRQTAQRQRGSRRSHMNMTVWDWFGQRSFSHREFSGLAGSGATRSAAVTLILPAREVAGTIGPILDTVASLNERTGLVDQVLVIDADSADGTANVARAHGAEVYSENDLLPQYGPAQGKGDAMWRALSVARGDIVMFADADTRDFGEHFLYGTLGPLLMVPGIQFTKAAYRRPFISEGRYLADGGGRVTELTAKPLLNFFFPELTGFVQPLAGEFAASRELLLRIPFLTGYGVEIAILIDVLRDAGLSAMAQVDLGSRQNRHQPLWDLTRMSSAVLRALARRVPALENTAPAPGLWGLPGPAAPRAYLHAVATPDGLRLDEHLSELPERPPMDRILAEVPAYPVGM